MVLTDNSYLKTKIKLRLDHLPNGEIRVIDAYGGYGFIWQEIAKITSREIHRFGIDKEKRPSSIRGDNRKWMKGLNLSLFNIIDLDAYGIPFQQMEIVFKKDFRGGYFLLLFNLFMGKYLLDWFRRMAFLKKCLINAPPYSIR